MTHKRFGVTMIGKRILLATAFIVALQGLLTAKEPRNTKALRFFNDASEEPVVIHARENLTSDKKITRKGTLYKRPHAKATVLICHAFTLNQYDASFLHWVFKDYNTMAFDFRAHGEDRGDYCCTFGRDESYEVVAAAQWIKNHPELKELPLFVYGFSMGAVAAIIAQAREKNLFDAMILDCPFDSSDKVIERGIQQLKMNIFGYEMQMPGSSFLKAYAYNPYVQSILKSILRTFTKYDVVDINTCICPVYPEEAIKYVTVPCFFIGCVNDDKVPEEAILAVYNGAQGYKRCWIDTQGRRHYDTIFRQMHTYFYRVDRFIKKILDGTYRDKVQEKITRDTPPITTSKEKE